MNSCVNLFDDGAISFIADINPNLFHTFVLFGHIAKSNPTIIYRITTRNGECRHRVNFLNNSWEHNIATSSLFARFLANMLVNFTLDSLIETNSLIRTEDRKHLHFLKQRSLDHKSTQSIQFSNSRKIAIFSTNTKFLNIINSFVSTLNCADILTLNHRRENFRYDRSSTHIPIQVISVFAKVV